MEKRKSGKNTHRYHHGHLQEALKKAALKLLRQKGARGFSLNEASRMAKVSVAAPYRHFADKDALLAEIICDGNAILAAEMRAAVALAPEDAEEQMVECGMAYLRFSVNHSDYFSLIFSSAINQSLYPEVQRSGQDTFSVILELAERTAREGESGTRRAMSAWALVHGLATLNAEGALKGISSREDKIEPLRAILQEFGRRS